MKSALLITLVLLSPLVYSGDWFIENMGQVKNQFGKSNNDVLYILNDNGLTITLRNQGFSYEVKRITNSTLDLKDYSKDYKFNASIERIDFEFPNHPSQIIAEIRSGTNINMYNENGAFENISQFKKVTYKNVSPGINIEFIIENGRFKYNIIAKPEADLANFFIKINSDKAPCLNKNKLILSTDHGEIQENIPFSFLENSKETVDVNYELDGDNLFFNDSKSSRKETLIIDPIPDLVWNTYFGGNQYDQVNDISVTNENDVYQTGFTMSLDNISTSGAFLETYQGDLDAFVSKFDIDGGLIWSTYYGGPQTERVYSVSSDSLDNCYISGSTFSTIGIATFGAHQETLDGADDIFILKLLSNGQRDWCTYHGGNGHDFITDMEVYNDTIFSVGHTTSTNNMSTPGVHSENNTTT